jgi:HK97 family phage major capsid protein
MTRLQTLIDEQNTVWTRMQDIQRIAEEQARDWTAEERENWDKAEARLSEVSGDIERLERAAKLEKVDRSQVVETGAPEGGRDEESERDAAYKAAFEAYMREGMSGIAPEQRRLLQLQGRSEERALATTPDAAGGFLVPDDFRNSLTETLKAFGGLMNFATIITTATGARLPWPNVDDTGNEGAILGQNTQIGEQDMTFGDEELGAYTYTSKLVRVPWQLLQDEAFGLEAFLARKLGERIGRAAARHWVSGTGTNQPRGLVTSATVGVTGAGVAAITYDDLIDLEHSVNPAYRQNARFLMGDGGLKVIRKLKDADGRPIWVPIPAPGFPATINGVPYSLDLSMDDPGAGKVPLLFGNIAAAYIIRQVQGVQLVTMKERYADFLQNGYFAYARMDATIDDPNAVRSFKNAAA